MKKIKLGRKARTELRPKSRTLCVLIDHSVDLQIHTAFGFPKKCKF